MVRQVNQCQVQNIIHEDANTELDAEIARVHEPDERWDMLANAMLIAAAPELLTVAEGCLGYLRALPKAHRPDPKWLTPLVAAIEKAIGHPV